MGLSEDVKFAIKLAVALCAAVLIIGYALFGEELFYKIAELLSLAP